LNIVKTVYFKIYGGGIDELNAFKVCPNCGRIFKNAIDFFSGTNPAGEENWDGHYLFFRNCACGSTITIEMCDR